MTGNRTWARFLLHPATVAIVLALLSVARQGFEFGINNNMFHVPIVLGFQDLPQFKDDEFIQSLRWYSTPLFLGLRYVLDDSTIVPGFFILHCGIRVLTCLGLYRLIALFGVENRLARAGALALIVFSTPAYGVSAIAASDLFIQYVTHSALAQAVAVLALAEIAAGRLLVAGWLGGLAFFLNAFVGGWLAPLLLGAGVGQLRQAGDRRVLRSLLIGAGGYLLGALPIVLWALQAPPSPEPFDYPAYLRFYYPDHYFIDRIAPGVLRSAVLALAAGVLALLLLPVAARRRAAWLLLGLGAVFAAGLLVNATTSSRLLFNLHLLRSDVLLTWVVLAVLAAATAQVLAGGYLPAVLPALLMPFVLMRATWQAELLVGLVAVLVLATHGRRWLPAAAGRLLIPPMARAIIFGASLLLAHAQGWFDPVRPRPLAAGATPNDRQFEGTRPVVSDWRDVATWVRQNTPPDATFLVPLWGHEFRVATRRRTWVDHKQGGTVMWAPATYQQWFTRVQAVGRLTSPEALLRYAAEHHIDFVILDKRPLQDRQVTTAPGQLVFDTRWLAVLRVPQADRPRGTGQPR